MSANAPTQPKDRPGTRHCLVPVNGGYRIERLREDLDFDPPMWTHAGWLNNGRKFRSRTEARDYMRSGVER